MTRKDIIIISVLLNTGLLAILFVTAIQSDQLVNLDESQLTHMESQIVAIPEKIVQPVVSEDLSTQSLATVSHDEVDLVLKDYIPYAPHPVEMTQEPAFEASVAYQAKEIEEIGGCVEIIVKKGDMLEKIARANGVTVSEIKRMNHLTSDKLKVGQLLKVPVTIPIVKATETLPSVKKIVKDTIAILGEPEYYIVKNGDNPWKIAKQYQVRFEDILKLNNLDEEKARNLKIGDRIRVK